MTYIEIPMKKKGFNINKLALDSGQITSYSPVVWPKFKLPT